MKDGDRVRMTQSTSSYFLGGGKDIPNGSEGTVVMKGMYNGYHDPKKSLVTVDWDDYGKSGVAVSEIEKIGAKQRRFVDEYFSEIINFGGVAMNRHQAHQQAMRNGFTGVEANDIVGNYKAITPEEADELISLEEFKKSDFYDEDSDKELSVESILNMEANIPKKGTVEEKTMKTADMSTSHEVDFDQLRQEIAQWFNVDDVEVDEEGRWGSWGEAGGFTVEGVEFNWIADEEWANRIAVEYVAQGLQDQPEMFTKDWLLGHLRISDVDKRMMVIDEENYVEEDFDDWSEEEKQGYMEDFKEGLENPYQYFVEEQGMYSPEDFFQASFISIDIPEASKDAVNVDGWAHFLSGYDGNYETLPSGVVIFGENQGVPPPAKTKTKFEGEDHPGSLEQALNE